MTVELGGHGGLEVGDDCLRSGDDRHQPDGGGGQGLFDRRWLTQRGCGEIAQDLFGQAATVTAPIGTGEQRSSSRSAGPPEPATALPR
jgi:hypothetical protein